MSKCTDLVINLAKERGLEIPDEELEKKIEKIKEIIAREGGEVKGTNIWGKRRLAYEIKKSKKGFYLLIQLTCEPHIVKEIEHGIKFIDGIQRFMTVVASGKRVTPISETDLKKTEEAM